MPAGLEIFEVLLRYTPPVLLGVVQFDTHGNGVRNDDAHHDVLEKITIHEILLFIPMSLCIPNTLTVGLWESVASR